MPDPDLLIRTGGKKRLSNFYYGNCLILKYTLLINYGLTLVKDFKILNHFKKVRRNFENMTN